MQHFRISLLTLVGCLLIVAGITLLPTSNSSVILAQDDEDREYVGASRCSTCHRVLSHNHDLTAHNLTLQEVSQGTNAILADFGATEDIRTVLFPEENEPRPFTLDDVAFVLGSGRYVQRYLYEVGSDEYLVFPAEWNVNEAQWQPFDLGDDWTSEAYGWAENCAYCHTTGFNPDLGNWVDNGVQCEACHGPASVHLETIVDLQDEDLTGEGRAILESSINIGIDAQVCGQCHSQGFEPDGQRPYPVNYLPGQTLLDDDVFQLVPQDDPVHWWATGHAAQKYMQFNEWVNTGHSQSLTDLHEGTFFAVSCLNCHNVTYNRAVRQAVLFESDENTHDYEDLLRGLLDELGGDDSRGEIEEFQSRLIETLELDATIINSEQSFITQVMPHVITRLHDDDVLGGSAFVPQSLDAIINAMTEEGAELPHDLGLMGVTCAACHNPHSEPPQTLVNEDTYALCTDCHNNANINRIHHPVQEVFEGRTLIENIEGIPGGHFTAEDGPRCISCHMPTVPVDAGSRVSHFMSPILPEDAVDIDALQDACSGCHAELVSTGGLQELVDAIQIDTQQRLEAAQQALSDDTPEWVVAALDVVEGDGSLGIHNYAYTGALLAGSERELGIATDTRLISADDLPLPVRVDTTIDAPAIRSDVVQDGLNPAGIVLLAVAAAILLLSAYIFFIRQGDE